MSDVRQIDWTCSKMLHNYSTRRGPNTTVAHRRSCSSVTVHCAPMMMIVMILATSHLSCKSKSLAKFRP